MTAPRPEEENAVPISVLDSLFTSSNRSTVPKNDDDNSNSNNIRVVVRIRPSSSSSSSSAAENAEEPGGTPPVVTSLNAVLLGEKNASSSSSSPELVQVTLNNKNDSGNVSSNHRNNNDSMNKRWFELDAVLDPQATQADVYERSGARHAIQHSLWEGYNCTLLAYGQSGAGKTFTMMGNSSSSTSTKESGESGAEVEHDAGLIPRACHDLFQQIQEKCQGNAQVEFSFLEIYNETLRDLLVAPVPSTPNQNNTTNNNNDRAAALHIRETTRTGEVYVAGLTARRVASPHDIQQLLHEASQRRVTGSTALNAVSSRSHALCILQIRGTTNTTANGGLPQQFQSKLTLVDLAGSERLKKTGALGNRQKEGININKSLLVLGQVVAALSEQQQKPPSRGNNTPRRKPPYRDSKLTRLLQDSLGGNSRTILVACVSPDACHVEESINTLRYATAARNICNTATRNVVAQNPLLSPAQVTRLQRENQRLQQQVLELQAAVQRLEGIEEEQRSSVVSSTVSFDSSSDEDKKLSSLLDDGSSEALTEDTTVPSSESSSSSSSSAHQQLEPPHESYAGVDDDNNNNNDDDILRELIDLKTENCELRAELDEVRADAAASKRAAVQLSNVMDQLQQLQGEQVAQKRLEYRHLQKEEKWVQFLSDMLDTRCEEMGKLADDFDLVVRVVESCPDVTVVPPSAPDELSTFSASPSSTTTTTTTASERPGQRSRRWLQRVSSDVLSQVGMNLSSHNGHTGGGSGGGTNTNRGLSADDQELRQQLLRQHVVFFKMQMDEIVNCIRVEGESLLQIRMSLRRDRERLENEIGTSEFVMDSLDSADGQLLQQLTTLLIGPVREV